MKLAEAETALKVVLLMDVMESGHIADKLQEILDAKGEAAQGEAPEQCIAAPGYVPVRDAAADAAAAPALTQLLKDRLTGKSDLDEHVTKYWELAEKTVRQHVKLIVDCA